MALWTNHLNVEVIRNAFNTFQRKCIFEDHGFFSNEDIWTKENISEFKRLFIDNPMYADSGSFYDKFEKQLQPSKPAIKKLSAEALWLLFLFSSKTSHTPQAKRQEIVKLWEASGSSFPGSEYLDDPVLEGLANPGTFFMTNRPKELIFLILLIDAWKNLSIQQQNELSQDPWGFCDWIFNLNKEESYSFRHMILHLWHPRHFERICSKNHKKIIYKTFKGSAFPKHLTDTDLERSILEIRENLEREYNTDKLDFYVDPLRTLWYPEKDEKDKKQAQPPRDGENWTQEEVTLIVHDYFEMLELELKNIPFSKTEHRNKLMSAINRSKGSVEFKHQNISAILHELAFPYIKGYKPGYANYQAILAETVEAFIERGQSWLEKTDQDDKPVPPKFDVETVFVSPVSNLDGKKDTATRRHLIRKFDPAQREGRNKKLGYKGEEFVIDVEKKRLNSLGRSDLAAKVYWLSKEKGDGAGYDIDSFDIDGSPIFIEVKTTRGDIAVPFYISNNEIAVAQEKGESYKIYRVFDIEREPRIYTLNGPLEEVLDLEPLNYRARTK